MGPSHVRVIAETRASLNMPFGVRGQCPESLKGRHVSALHSFRSYDARAQRQ